MRKTIEKTAFSAFKSTIPIMAAFIFLGLTYGIYMNSKGFSFAYPMLMSLTIFSGAMEFLSVEILSGHFQPLQIFLLALMVNFRHIFYSIAMLDKFKGMGAKKAFLIFSLCDETFSLSYDPEVEAEVDKNYFIFFVSLFNYLYWFIGASLGGIFGSLININTKGLDFVLTAMFTIIIIEQILKEKDHSSTIIGILSSISCLLIFGPDKFILPSMILIILGFEILRKRGKITQ